ncbi:MAG TPA: hypothetical protein VM925_26220 [Labilithrix sp.]|jgi:hypothetical protein|nr:hypothetical protein [Labilithrix sp.]
MKGHFSLNAVALGILATALSGCGDEGISSEPRPTKSAITARTFGIDGCDATGVFDISSSDPIDFVAFDKSPFSKVKVELFALDKDKVEVLIADSQNLTNVDEVLASQFDRVSNTTSAEQDTEATNEQAAKDAARSSQSASADQSASNFATSANTNTTTQKTESESSEFSRTDASGFDKSSRSKDGKSTSSETTYDRSDQVATKTAASERLFASNEAISSLSDAQKSTVESNASANSSNELTASNSAKSAASQSAESEAENSATSEAKSKQFTALSTLREFKAKTLVLKLQVRAKTKSAVVGVFTGNTADTIAAHQDFEYDFVDCAAPETTANAP